MCERTNELQNGISEFKELADDWQKISDSNEGIEIEVLCGNESGFGRTVSFSKEHEKEVHEVAKAKNAPFLIEQYEADKLAFKTFAASLVANARKSCEALQAELNNLLKPLN